MGLNQYDIVRHMQDERIIRESEVSVIEGKTGLRHLWPVYELYLEELIEGYVRPEPVKEVMRLLLKQWKEA